MGYAIWAVIILLALMYYMPGFIHGLLRLLWFGRKPLLVVTAVAVVWFGRGRINPARVFAGVILSLMLIGLCTFVVLQIAPWIRRWLDRIGSKRRRAGAAVKGTFTRRETTHIR